MNRILRPSGCRKLYQDCTGMRSLLLKMVNWQNQLRACRI